ncbi:hypothetical protein IU449_26795 [Nocardia higoensis]|uniref:Uncharacterized protein n=1 Tax=Nocardia higoensis TaxID=228599 RepID=A0ABS0DN21_9NOCA|nr:hypothetical protein [Nocardia higoensis]MBF6358108.1 hypothetical protein [Nocardia higoensis]
MTPDEIRALAAERVARAEYDDWKTHYDAITNRDVLDSEPPAPSFDNAPDDYGPKQAYRRRAQRVVDALAELLPVAVEQRYLGRGMDRKTRYVTNWIEHVEEP